MKSKLFLPYDVYERHLKVGSFIGIDETVLDVGGELGHLSQFCKPKKITVANLNSGDIIIKPGKLPFKKNAFDTVCAIDVLEHIPKQERPKFLKNLVDVCANKVILSFPLGTKEHALYEQKVYQQLESQNINVQYLSEHLQFGLPTISEIDELFQKLKYHTYFSGNLKINYILFKIFLFDPKVKFARRAVYLLKRVFNLLTNPPFYTLLMNRPYSKLVNRVYIVVEKQ